MWGNLFLKGAGVCSGGLLAEAWALERREMCSFALARVAGLMPISKQDLV